jgi:hypothetical protein
MLGSKVPLVDAALCMACLASIPPKDKTTHQILLAFPDATAGEGEGSLPQESMCKSDQWMEEPRIAKAVTQQKLERKEALSRVLLLYKFSVHP